MAQYHFHVEICSGGTGAAVAASSYQTGQKLTDDLGRKKEYKDADRVVYTNLLTPDNAPAWAKDRQKLWQEVERIEGIRGQYARKYNIALPNELSIDQQIELADQIADYYLSRGMVVDYAVHQDLNTHKTPDQRNTHLHIMTTMRAFKPDGNWDQKWRNVTVRDKNGKAICVGRDKNGRKRYKHKKVATNNWSERDELINQRKMVADISNAALAKAGFSARIDHRSYKEQGVMLIPTKHLGHANAARERRGIHTPVGDYNRRVMEINNDLRSANNHIAQIDKEIEGVEKNERKQRSNEIARKRKARTRREQTALSKRSFAAESIKMYYMRKRMVDAHGIDSRSFATSKSNMFVRSKWQRSGMVSRRSRQDHNTRMPKLQLLSWRDLNRSERQVLLNELKKDSNWVFATDAAKYNMSQRAMFVRNGGHLAMYPLGSGVSRYKPGDKITAQDLQTDCRAAYRAASSAGRDAGRALKSAADSVSDLFDCEKRPQDHLKAAAKSIKDAAQAPVKIAQDIISNPIAGLLKAPLRVASAASSAASAATHTVAAAVKTGIKAGGKANTAASGGGFSSQRGSSRDDDDWDNLLTDADKVERREKQLYRI